MIDKEEILKTLREHKAYFQKEMGLEKIGLFGSYAMGLQTSESDIDIFLELEDNDYKKLLEILIFLEQKFNKKVDLTYTGDHLRPAFLHTLERETIYA